MTGLNHGLVGGAIAHYLPLPIAIPLALASHFLMDALPHFGMPHHDRDRSKFWIIFFTIDALATFFLAAYAILTRHYAMFLGGLAGVIPDFIWVGRVIRTRSFDLSQNDNWFTKTHVGIQRLERPWGLWFELPLTTFLLYWVIIVIW